VVGQEFMRGVIRSAEAHDLHGGPRHLEGDDALPSATARDSRIRGMRDLATGFLNKKRVRPRLDRFPICPSLCWNSTNSAR